MQFLSNLSRNAIARQVAEELHSVTWVVWQFFCWGEALRIVELSSTFRNGFQQLTTPLHSVSPLQQLVPQFYGSFKKGASTHFLFFVPRSIARQLLRKLHSVTGPQHQTSATCNAKFSTIARQVAEKIPQCNRAFKKLHL